MIEIFTDIEVVIYKSKLLKGPYNLTDNRACPNTQDNRGRSNIHMRSRLFRVCGSTLSPRKIDFENFNI